MASLGTVAFQRGEYAQALDWHQRSIESTTSVLVRAFRQGFVARDLVALRRFADAVAVGSAVLESADAPASTKANAALELGYAYLGLGQPQEADEHFVTALAVYDVGRVLLKQAEALQGRAQAARARGDLRAAIQFGEQSLQRVEAVRANVAVPELRAFYSGAHADYYETQIEALAEAYRESGQPMSEFLLASLSVSERARARMIVDLLSEASIRLDRGLPETVLRRERQLYDELSALRKQRDRALEKPSAEGAELEPLVRRMVAIENELSLLALEARSNDFARASVAAPAPLNAEEIQASLDDRSVLLQYALGTPKSYVWVVTRDSLRLVELADRATIESAARRVHENLKTYRPGASSDERTTQLRELSALILDPVAPAVSSAYERLIIAADGALGYIPFGVLPLMHAGETVPVLQVVEVTNVPSMSAMAAQRRRAEQPPSKTLAVFADAVFASTDARVIANDGRGNVAASSVLSSTLSLERLPATGVEASAIAELVAQDSRLVVTGFDANREQVLNASLRDYRIVHFATHGLVDSRYPGLSALVFSQWDPAGQPRNGLLRLQDVYRLDLNADLVVLSGCETALGREIRGEGLIGLVDGFLYAGARNLVVSLGRSRTERRPSS